MGLFGKSNKCPFKDQCPSEEICSHVTNNSYKDCTLYEDWSGDGANKDNSCPYKDECSLYPFSCLWGDCPSDCFHYDTFTRKHGDDSSCNVDDSDYDEEDDSDYSNDTVNDHFYSFDNTSSGDLYRGSMSERTAKIEADRKLVQLEKELVIAKKQAELERIERRKTDEAERLEAKKKYREQLNNSKNYLVASLLAIFLGWLGIHKFYIGKYTSGVIYLVLYWTWIPGILGIIQGVKWLLKGQDKFIDELVEE